MSRTQRGLRSAIAITCRPIVLAALAANSALASDEAFIHSRRPLGGYLEIQLAGEVERRILLPATPVCVQLSRPEARVRFVGRGFPGRLESPDGSGDARCEAAGVLDLERIRDRQPRPHVPFAPRETAVWKTIHRDGRLALLRGRFRLARLIGMAGGHDLVAVVADDASCADVVDGKRGALEFRDTGQAFRLSAGRTRCHVLGFARPLPQRQ